MCFTLSMFRSRSASGLTHIACVGLPRLSCMEDETQKVYVVVHPSVLPVMSSTACLSFDAFAEHWPANFSQKWIPLAPSADAAGESWQTSPAYKPGYVVLLEIHVPEDTWKMWLKRQQVVPNPGWKRSGESHTERKGHWLYGRVPKDKDDPVLDLDGFQVGTCYYIA